MEAKANTLRLRVMTTTAPPATILIRLSVGVTFALEGLQKFLYPGELGAGRFESIGIPAADFFGPAVGATELVCGLLVLAGLGTRLASIPLVCIMIVALVTTKLPILLGHGFWGLSLRELSRYGFLSMMHESRTDLAMLLGGGFLVGVGAGPWSLDARIRDRRAHAAS